MKRPLEDRDDGYEANPIVFLDFAVSNVKVGRVVLELFIKSVPKTARNFLALCTGEKGIGLYGKPLHYKGSLIHKVVPQCMIQGGDIINFDGTGGESIYGKYFDDESFEHENIQAGCLVMVNKGLKNSNSSQFVITSVPCPHLDGTNVVFGKVIKGMGTVVELNEVETIKDVPQRQISIIDCGALKKGEPLGLEDRDGTEDVFPPWPEDWDHESLANERHNVYVVNVIEKIKNSGNQYFTKKNYDVASRKYDKALRYYDWMMKFNYPMAKTGISDATEIKVIILLNQAVVKLKQDRCREALKICNKVLSLDSNNGKAMYRRGLAHMGLNEYQLALIDMKQALERIPNNKEIMQGINKLNKIKDSYLVYEKKVCVRMFK